MVRYVIDDDPYIEIAYGSDEATGLFLSVYDRRLGWCQGASDEVNAITRKVGCGDGEGGYFDLHTGINGFGQRVSVSTIITYMYRYGVPKKHIDELLSSEELIGSRNLDKSVKEMDINKGKHDESGMMAPPISSTAVVAATACTHCGQTASQRCAKCHKNSGQEVFYCSKKCQQVDWSTHKHFCSLPHPMMTFPKTISGVLKKTVVAVFLPENDPKASFIEMPYELKTKPKEGEGWFWVPKLLVYDDPSAKVLSEESLKGHSSTNVNVTANRPLKHTLHFLYRESFLTDGSQPNKCVSKLLNGAVPPRPWKGPVLVMKDQGAKDRPDYLDMQVSDAVDIVDFFRTYVSDQ